MGPRANAPSTARARATASEAVSALAEGDATSAMFDVMIARRRPDSGKTALDMPDELFAEQIRAGMNEGPAQARRT